MSEVELKARLLAWGNSFGLRLSRQDIQRLGLAAGNEVTIHLDVPAARASVDLPVLHLGGKAADEHDELFGQSAAEDLE